MALGGTSLWGGRGGLIGPMLGAASIYLLGNLLITLQVDPSYLQVMYGGMLIFAVILSGIAGRAEGGGMSAVPAEASAESSGRVTWQPARAPAGALPVAAAVACSSPSSPTALSTSASGTGAASSRSSCSPRSPGSPPCGQTLLILMGGFDLSISGFIVSSALVVSVLKEKWHVSFVGGDPDRRSCAARCSAALAGQICHRFQIQPLIVTLAMGTIALGLIQVQTEGSFSGTAPEWLITLASPGTKTFGVIDIPPMVVIWAVRCGADGALPPPHGRPAGGCSRPERIRAPPSTP